MKNIFKKIVIFLSGMLGFVAVLATAVSIRLTAGMDNEALKQLYKYSTKFGLNNPAETKVTFLMMFISDNAYIIVTAGVIWILIFAFLWEKNRRIK